MSKEEKKKNNTLPKRLLTVEETAYYLGLSKQTIYNRINPKTKNPFPVKPKAYGRKRLFDIKDLEAYADSLQ